MRLTLTLALALAVIGCQRMPSLLPDAKPDMVTRRGILVWFRDGQRWPDIKRRRCEAYLDAAELSLRKSGVVVRLSGVKFVPEASRVTGSGIPLAGYAYIGKPKLGMEVVWFRGWGPYAYPHERIHQDGYRHAEGVDYWRKPWLTEAQQDARRAGEAAMSEIEQ